MELLTHKDKHTEYSCYLDKNGNEVVHGEYKDYHFNRQRWGHFFIYHGLWHGECKVWDMSGKLISHCFYIHGEEQPYVEMNEQEKLLFQIQYPGFRFIEE